MNHTNVYVLENHFVSDQSLPMVCFCWNCFFLLGVDVVTLAFENWFVLKRKNCLTHLFLLYLFYCCLNIAEIALFNKRKRDKTNKMKTIKKISSYLSRFRGNQSCYFVYFVLYCFVLIFV